MKSIAIVALIAFVVLIIIMLISDAKSSSNTSEPNKQQDDAQQPGLTTLTYPKSPYKCFRIAGINNYCDFSDVGPISGELRKEPENRYDRNAVMIIEANKEKILGYIPKHQQAEYKKISQGMDRRPFVGFIETFINEDGRRAIYGIIRTYSGKDDTVMDDAQNDWNYLHTAFAIKSHEKRQEALNQFKY